MSTGSVERQPDHLIRRQVEHVMGMPISVAVRGRHATTAAGRGAWQAVVDQLREVDRVFSTYREGSIIRRLGQRELTIDECPAEVAEVLELGRQAEGVSGGAFSIFLPDPDGHRRLDPSGVVKGWAAQRASHFLANLDDTDFCLSAGGDIISHTADPDAPAWRIGIEDPHNPKSLIAVVPVRSGAVATSGTAHRGKHLVDARTGQPVEGVASVTVIGHSLTWADIDATAAYAHGPQAAQWLGTRPGRTALVVWPNGDTTVIDGRSGTEPIHGQSPDFATHVSSKRHDLRSVGETRVAKSGRGRRRTPLNLRTGPCFPGLARCDTGDLESMGSEGVMQCERPSR